MTELIVFVAFGGLFLLLLVLWAWGSGGTTKVHRRDDSEAQAALAVAQLGPSERFLGEKIFSFEDLAFVTRQASPPIRRLFLQERKQMALLWLRDTQSKVKELMDFHRHAVRGNARLSPAMEFRIAAGYLFFLLACQVLLLLIWLRGPFYARTLAGRLAGISDRLYDLSGQMLAGLDSACLSRIANSWTSRSASA